MTGVLLAVSCAIGEAIAATKAEEPYTEVKDGVRSMRLWVNGDVLARFEIALKNFRRPRPTMDDDGQPSLKTDVV